MCDGVDQRVPSNAEILTNLTELRAEQQELRAELREHRAYVERSFVPTTAFDESLQRMTGEVVRRVSATLHAMMRDAMTSAMREERNQERATARDEMRTMYREERAAERAERREDMRDAVKSVLTSGKLIGAYVAPIAIVIGQVGHWIGWW
jgi:beta-phosphoglucomutase-like phosphatase (HAD superfamily)